MAEPKKKRGRPPKLTTAEDHKKARQESTRKYYQKKKNQPQPNQSLYSHYIFYQPAPPQVPPSTNPNTGLHTKQIFLPSQIYTQNSVYTTTNSELSTQYVPQNFYEPDSILLQV
jgi:hypothetical protein